MPITKYFGKRKHAGTTGIAKRARYTAARRAVSLARGYRRKRAVRGGVTRRAVVRRKFRRRRFIGKIPAMPGSSYITIKNTEEWSYSWALKVGNTEPDLQRIGVPNTAWIPSKTRANAFVKNKWNSFTRHKLMSVNTRLRNFRIIYTTVIQGRTAAVAPIRPGDVYSVNTNEDEDFVLRYWFEGCALNKAYPPGKNELQELRELKVRNGRGYIYRKLIVPGHRMNACGLDYDRFADQNPDIEKYFVRYNQEKTEWIDGTAADLLVPNNALWLKPEDIYPTGFLRDLGFTNDPPNLEARYSITLTCDVDCYSRWHMTQPKAQTV